METHTVALVLGAGGRVGGRFIGGALDELGRATGWRAEWADTVVGTSIGAIVGSRLDTAAADAAAVAALAELAEPVAPRVIDRPVAAARNLGGRLVAAVTPSGSRSPDELVPPRGDHPNVWVCSVRHRRPARRVASLAVAADPAAEVAASSAVPGVFTPVSLEGAPHIDGALWSSTNADRVPAGVDVVVAIAPMAGSAMGLSRLHLAQLRVELAGRRAVVVVPDAEGRRAGLDGATEAGRRAVRHLVGGGPRAGQRQPSAVAARTVDRFAEKR